jgi:hypothetical protein
VCWREIEREGDECCELTSSGAQVGGERVDWNAQNDINGDTVLMRALTLVESWDTLQAIKMTSLLSTLAPKIDKVVICAAMLLFLMVTIFAFSDFLPQVAAQSGGRHTAACGRAQVCLSRVARRFSFVLVFWPCALACDGSFFSLLVLLALSFLLFGLILSYLVARVARRFSFVLVFWPCALACVCSFFSFLSFYLPCLSCYLVSSCLILFALVLSRPGSCLRWLLLFYLLFYLPCLILLFDFIFPYLVFYSCLISCSTFLALSRYLNLILPYLVVCSCLISCSTFL